MVKKIRKNKSYNFSPKRVKSPKKVVDINQCQASTLTGKRCSRNAKIQLDLRKGKKILGYEVVPKTNCCFYCLQHAAVITGYQMYKLGWLLAESKLDWDEYIVIHPEYLDQKMKEMS